MTVDRHPWPEAMAGLVPRIGHDGRLRQVRDVEYIGWRYRNPLSTYRFLYAVRDATVDGYLVLSTKAREHAPEVEAYIVDWEGTDLATRAELLRAVLQWDGFESLVTWGTGRDPETRRLLAESGFEPAEPPGSIARPQRSLLVRGVADGEAGAEMSNGRSPLDVANWDLRMVYSDGF